jgi:hypothetical protein
MATEIDLETNLISFWRLEEPTGGNAFDHFGDNDLSHSNNPDSAAGFGNLGSGRHFRGNSSFQRLFITDANQTDLGMGTDEHGGSFTVMAWVNFDSLSTAQTILGKYDSALTTGEYRINYRTDIDRFTFELRQDNSVIDFIQADSLGSPSTGTWYFIIAWYDSSADTLSIQINNGTVDSKSWGNNIQNGNTAFHLGALDFGFEVVDGRILAVGVWREALNSAEREFLWHIGNGIQLPFTDITDNEIGIVPNLGGWVQSVTPINVASSGQVGGYTQRFSSFPGSGDGVFDSTQVPNVGGYIAVYRNFPTENPNTITSGEAALGDTNFLESYWPMNDASGNRRTDINSKHDLIPVPYKVAFEAPYTSLNTNIKGYYRLDEHDQDERLDGIGLNHLRETVLGTAVRSEIGLAGTGSGIYIDRGDNVYVRKSSPSDDVHPGSGDWTVAGWTRIDGEFNLNKGIIGVWTSTGSQREWLLTITANTNPLVSIRQRFGFRVSPDGITNTFAFASGDGSGPLIEAEQIYFVAGRFSIASGSVDITVASGADFSTRIFNISEPNLALTSGVFESSAELALGSFNTGTQLMLGALDEFGFWADYLTDSDLETLFNGGSGLSPQYPDDATSIGGAVDNKGPGLEDAINKLGTGASVHLANEGLDDKSGEYFVLYPGQGGEAFDFNGTENFTFAGWVRFKSGGNRAILAKGRESRNQRGYRLYRSSIDNLIHWQLSTTGASYNIDITAGSSISVDTWYFIECGYDTTTNVAFLRIDNGTVTNSSIFTTINSNDAPFEMGEFNISTTTFVNIDGYLDAWGCWTKVLAPQERNVLYSNGVGRELAVSDLDVAFDPAFIGYNEPGSTIGGHLFSKVRPDQTTLERIGGITKAPGSEISARVGAYCLSLPLTDFGPAFIGGFGSGLFEFGPNEEPQGILPRIGGWLFGRPDFSTFIEQHSRTLVKVRSEDIIDQALNLDAKVIFAGRDEQDFNALLTIFNTVNTDFNARLEVAKFKQPPTITITNVESNTLDDGCVYVQVTASGNIVEPNAEWNYSNIDFADPLEVVVNRDGTIPNRSLLRDTLLNSVSGFGSAAQLDFISDNGASGVVWTSDHVFCSSGVYQITASIRDTDGMTSMDVFELDLLPSGSLLWAGITETPIAGQDYPALAISGLPRFGNVGNDDFGAITNQDVLVYYGATLSGFFSDNQPNKFVFANLQDVSGVVQKIDERIHWQFGQGAKQRSILNPFANYRSPGFYIPVARYRYLHPSGTSLYGSGLSPRAEKGLGVIWIQDTLKFGFVE